MKDEAERVCTRPGRRERVLDSRDAANLDRYRHGASTRWKSTGARTGGAGRFQRGS